MMKHRLILSGLLAMLMAWTFNARAEQYQEGVHYVALQIPIKTRAAGKIEVAEYFSYGCPHCYSFEPYVAAWHAELSKDVKFVRTPAIWNEDYKVYAQAYYTAQELKVLDRVHGPLFRAIQQQGLALNTPKSMARFFETQGVDLEDFAKAYKSFGVSARVQQADSRGRSYRSTGVPAIIVNGKYRIEGGMAGSNAEMLKIADFLIERERQSLKPAALKEPSAQ